MKIAVIGTGYVGLTTGACLAEIGHQVTCVDIDEKKIHNLQNGIIPIFEPYLEDLVQKNSATKNLSFSTDAKTAIQNCEIIISAVGTPPNQDHEADLTFVKQVAKTFGETITEYKIFINKSTVPVDTGHLCTNIIQEELDRRNIQVEFDAVSNPEFLREGSAVQDTLNPDRIVFGTNSPRPLAKLQEIYKNLPKKDIPTIYTDIKTAELIKYAANCFLATKISFINEIANYCDQVQGGDINTIADAIGLDHRIGRHFLNAGIGYGGSCFPKDVKALIQAGKRQEFEFKILKSVDQTNEKQKTLLFDKLVQEVSTLKNETIAFLGLSYKPNTDDLREAPSIPTIKKLLQAGAKIQAFDPVSGDIFSNNFSHQNLEIKKNLEEALKDSTIILIATEWPEFKALNPDFLIQKAPKAKLLLDGRNLLSAPSFQSSPITYKSIGRPTPTAQKRAHSGLKTAEKKRIKTSSPFQK